eukprot:Rhum_TRINITY_DN14534_c1_g1::Rhum_TRINITY_DN14534_c1_g1_i1::g.95563::m.95563
MESECGRGQGTKEMARFFFSFFFSFLSFFSSSQGMAAVPCCCCCRRRASVRLRRRHAHHLARSVERRCVAWRRIVRTREQRRARGGHNGSLLPLWPLLPTVDGQSGNCRRSLRRRRSRRRRRHRSLGRSDEPVQARRRRVHPEVRRLRAAAAPLLPLPPQRARRRPGRRRHRRRRTLRGARTATARPREPPQPPEALHLSGEGNGAHADEPPRQHVRVVLRVRHEDEQHGRGGLRAADRAERQRQRLGKVLQEVAHPVVAAGAEEGAVALAALGRRRLVDVHLHGHREGHHPVARRHPAQRRRRRRRRVRDRDGLGHTLD